MRVSPQTLFNVKRRYLSEGFDSALLDKARPGRPVRIDGTQRAKITALACSAPPEGHARWSLRLLADKAVESQLCDSVSHNAVKGVLKKIRENALKAFVLPSGGGHPRSGASWRARGGFGEREGHDLR